jgi:polar amino acid transport system substrate-binding protein
VHKAATRLRRSAISAGLMVMALTAAACGGGRSGATVQGVQLVSKGALTTCTHLPYAPFQSERGGKVVGFDVDVIDLVAKRLGVTQKIIDTPFETIKTGSALNAGKCDIAAAGMTINADRAAFIDFSEPYFTATQALMARKGTGATSLDEVKAKKLRLGSQASTTGEAYVHGKGLDSTSFKDSGSELNGLRSGQVAVIVADYPVVAGWLKDPANSTFELIANLDTGEQYGFAARKGRNPRLLAMVDQVIEQSRKDGTYQSIYRKWIGPTPAGA